MTTPTPSTTSFLGAIGNRMSCYTLTKSTPIPDTRIHEIVSAAIKNGPSPFNVQSARAIILVKSQHDKLWDIAHDCLKQSMPEPAYQAIAPRVKWFRDAYGTVMWFEDQEALEGLKAKNPGIQHVIPQWSAHSSGMHQFIAWTALELEGLGCNLQHYDFMPGFVDEVRKEWNIPENWMLHSQLVLGKPVDGVLKRSRERTYEKLEERVMMHGA